MSNEEALAEIRKRNNPRERALRAVAKGEVNSIESIILRWQWNDHGDFYTALWEAITRADENNLAKLGLAFPEEVQAFIVWKTTWVAQSLRERGYLD